MAVLLQYNVSTTWTATQLSDATGIKMDLLLQVIFLGTPKNFMPILYFRNYFHENIGSTNSPEI